MEKKKISYIKGKVIEMTSPEVVTMPDGKLITRATVTVEIEPGQLIFFQVRYSLITFIKSNPQLVNVPVKIGFICIGTKKQDRYYNNLFISKIDAA